MLTHHARAVQEDVSLIMSGTKRSRRSPSTADSTILQR